MAEDDELSSELSPWERNFREQMVRIREDRGMSQTHLAKRLSNWGLAFHQQTIQRIEIGKRPIRLNEANLIARELGVDLQTMMAASTPSARGMMLAVSEMRSSADHFVSNLVDDLGEWAEATAGLVLAVEDLLKQYDPANPDPVLKYGYSWGVRAGAAYRTLVSGLNSLTDLVEGHESGTSHHFAELEAIEHWPDHDELLTDPDEVPEIPADDPET